MNTYTQTHIAKIKELFIKCIFLLGNIVIALYSFPRRALKATIQIMES